MKTNTQVQIQPVGNEMKSLVIAEHWQLSRGHGGLMVHAVLGAAAGVVMCRLLAAASTFKLQLFFFLVEPDYFVNISAERIRTGEMRQH